MTEEFDEVMHVEESVQFLDIKGELTPSNNLDHLCYHLTGQR